MGDYLKQSQALVRRAGKRRRRSSAAPAHRHQWPLPDPTRVRRPAFRRGDHQGHRRPARARLSALERAASRLIAPRQARDFPLKNIPLRRVGIFLGLCLGTDRISAARRAVACCSTCACSDRSSRAHQIVVVHDATVRALPENFSARFRAAYGFLLPRLCRRADMVVTVSEFSRREIGKWYGADIDAMPVCFEGGDHITAVPADPAVLDRLNLTGRKFFLGVGVDSANKNIADASWRLFTRPSSAIPFWC